MTTRAEQRLGQEIETSTAAQEIAKPGWKIVSQRWVHVGSADGNTAARILTAFGAAVDSILRNKPVRWVISYAGPPGSASVVIGRATDTKQNLQVGGIVVGAMSGQPVVVSACFRSLKSDDFTRSLAAGIARELGTIGLTRVPTSSSEHKLATRAPIG